MCNVVSYVRVRLCGWDVLSTLCVLIVVVLMLVYSMCVFTVLLYHFIFYVSL